MGVNRRMTAAKRREYRLAARYLRAIGLDVTSEEEGALSVGFRAGVGGWCFTGPWSAVFGPRSASARLRWEAALWAMAATPGDRADAAHLAALELSLGKEAAFGRFSSWDELELMLDARGI